MTKYLTAAIACKKLTVAHACVILEVKRLQPTKRVGEIAKQLGLMTDADLAEVDLYLADQNRRGTDIPDCVAGFGPRGHDEFANRLPDFVLQEYWQLRQEIRDRMTGIRTVLGVAVGAFTAVVAATATLISRSGDPNFVALALLWLAPHAVLLPSMKVIFWDRLTVISLARYIRLHLELPFFEAASKWMVDPNKRIPFVRMPLGWESHLLVVRIAGHEMRDKDSKLHKYLEYKKHGSNNDRNQDNWWKNKDTTMAALTDSELIMQPEVFTDDTDGAKNCKAIEASHTRDRMESTSITWIMRSLSTASTSLCVTFFILLCVSGQIDKSVAVLKQAWVAYIIVASIPLTAITLMITLWIETKRFTAALRVKNFWDVPGLDFEHACRLIAKFRDGR
ncbi:MAG: hypothetical protein ACKVW3_14335 [Phycisphaerales bacterium]